MNEKNCSLIFTGELVEGKTLDQVHENLAEAFKTDAERIQRMFAKQGNVIKKNADRATCMKMQKMIYDAGAVCAIDPPEEVMEEAPELEPEEVLEDTPAQAQANPYEAPKADLKTDQDKQEQGFMGIQKKRAGRGASWIFQAVSLFIQRPFKWILITIVYFLVNIIVFIPLIGALIMSLISSVYNAGFVIGGKELDETGELPVGVLFRGFKQGFGSLVLLNILMICAMFLSMALCVGIGYALLGVDMSNLQNQMMGGGDPTRMIGAMAVVYLLMFAAVTPIMMAYWFSPALISINGKTTFEAIKLSFSACLKNWLPFLIYGLVLLIFFIVFMAVIGGIAGASFSAAMAGKGSFVLTFIVMFGLMLALMPIGILTVYTAYKDIFYTREGSV